MLIKIQIKYTRPPHIEVSLNGEVLSRVSSISENLENFKMVKMGEKYVFDVPDNYVKIKEILEDGIIKREIIIEEPSSLF